MTYEIKILSRGKNFSGCNSFKGYRKTLKQCITAAQNYILTLTDKRIYEVRISITSFGRKVYGWKYIPTFR